MNNSLQHDNAFLQNEGVGFWTRLGRHLLFGYMVLALYFCCSWFAKSKFLIAKYDTITIHEIIFFNVIPFFVGFSSYVFFRQTIVSLHRYTWIKKTDNILCCFLDDFMVLFYLCYVPTLCIHGKKLFDTHIKYMSASTYFAEIQGFRFDRVVQYGIELSFIIILLLLALYIFTIVFRAIVYPHNINVLFYRDDVARKYACKTVRCVVRTQIQLFWYNIFWWHATLIVLSSMAYIMCFFFLMLPEMSAGRTSASNFSAFPSVSMAGMFGNLYLLAVSGITGTIMTVLLFYSILNSTAIAIHDCIAIVCTNN